MTNNKWIDKARIDLNSIITKYSRDSYLQMNRKKDGTFYKKHRPYTIPAEAKMALEHLRTLGKSEITLEQEEEVKAFLIPYRITRREFLEKDTNRTETVKFYRLFKYDNSPVGGVFAYANSEDLKEIDELFRPDTVKEIDQKEYDMEMNRVQKKNYRLATGH